jgi:hypothetical protein
MKDSRLLRPDFIVALLAVVIGLSTMFVYIYQARIMSKQMHATTWPRLETIISKGTSGFIVMVKNKGVGPAIVKNTVVILDEYRYADSKENLDSVAFKLTGKRDLLNGYTTVNNRVISAGEEIEFIEVTDSASLVLLDKSLRGHSFKIEICYCSVLGDCWLLVGGKTTECESCD